VRSIDRGLNIPATMNESSLGIPLKTVLAEDNNISYIYLTTEDNKVINFLDVIRKKASFLKRNHRHNITVFSSDYNFYLFRDNISYVLAVKRIDDYNIDNIRFSLQGVCIGYRLVLKYYINRRDTIFLEG
jgi:hypothetical protein